MIEVVLCDDHAMLRRGIRDTLSEAVDIRVVGEAANYSEVRDLLRRVRCDVVVLDLNLPGRGGLEVLQSMREQEHPARVVVCSMHEPDQYAVRCLRAGAFGYLHKAGDPAELVTAVRTAAQGRKYVTPEVAELLADSVSSAHGDEPHQALSEREMQTLVKIASCKRLSDIAADLTLSPKTVSVYRARVLEKLGLSNNAELTVYAIRNRLV